MFFVFTAAKLQNLFCNPKANVGKLFSAFSSLVIFRFPLQSSCYYLAVLLLSHSNEIVIITIYLPVHYLKNVVMMWC